MPVKKGTELTEKQQRFAQEYIVDCVGAAAYVRAGYSARNTKHASTMASRLLNLPHIQFQISQLQKTRRQKTRISGDRILEELAAIAFHRISAVIHFENGEATIRNTDDWEADSHIAVMEISGKKIEKLEGDDVVTIMKDCRLKTHDKLKALDMLAKITGLTNDFDMAISTLSKYGIELKRNKQTGNFEVG